MGKLKPRVIWYNVNVGSINNKMFARETPPHVMAHGRGSTLHIRHLRWDKVWIGGVVLRFLVSSRIWWGLCGVTIYSIV